MEIKMTSFLVALAVAACTAVFAEPTVVDGALTFNVAEGAEENWSGSIPEGVSKIVKTGSGHATITSANAAFKGSVVIENGVLEITHKEALGSGNTIEVLSSESGSGQYRVTLHQSAANGNTGNVKGNQVKIAGDGPDGNGAIYLDGTGRIDEMLGNVTLTGDATIGQWAGGYRGIAGELDLAGYTLTLDGSKHFVVNGSCKVKNMAHIINNVAVLLEDATYENCENALWTKNKYMSVYDISRPVPWSLVHNGGELCVPVDEDVYSGKAVGNVFYEDVTLNADLKLAKDYKAYIFLEFAGNVTGADHGISFSDSKTPARTVFSGSHSKIGALTIPNTNVTVEVTGRLDAKTVKLTSGTLDLNGGVLTTLILETSENDANEPRSCLNFNGGTFAAQTDTKYFFGSTVPNTVTVFERGAIFDTSLVSADEVRMCTKQYDPNLKFRAPSGDRPMGPIIKTGAGELQFNCTNLAFNGTFVVSNGTLKILRYAHLPDDVCVKLAGGVFVYDWTDRTFREIGGYGEIYGYKDQSYRKCTVTDALCFDAKDALEGKFLAFTCGTLAMGDALKVKIDNAETLATATFESGSPRHFDLMTLADGKTFSRLPECEGLPDRWRIRLANGATALQLCRDRGMSIVVR